MLRVTNERATVADEALEVPESFRRLRPGALWWIACVLAMAIGGYGLLLRDGRSVKNAVPGLPWLDEVHFAAGGLALAVGILCFRRDLLVRARAWHRRLGVLYVASVLASAAAGLVMAVFSMGGLTAHVGFAIASGIWIATTLLGWLAIQDRRIAQHRRWMVRSYALSFGAVTLRFELPLLIVWTGSFQTAYPWIAWLAWVPNLLFAEWWLARTDGAGRFRRTAATQSGD